MHWRQRCRRRCCCAADGATAALALIFSLSSPSCFPFLHSLQAYAKYREKRKKLNFGKKIRYQTRKVRGCGWA